MENIKKYAELFSMLYANFDGGKLGKKVAQKMFYFFERMGIELNLRYGIHYYGPYSSRLDNMMHILECEDYICIDTTGPTHVISTGEFSVDNFLSEEEKQIATFVIETFAHKKPLELEALATMDFVASSMNCSDKDEIIENFKLIKEDKFNSTIIDETYSILSEIGLISA